MDGSARRIGRLEKYAARRGLSYLCHLQTILEAILLLGRARQLSS
jgi:hypothetical protein